MEVPDMVAGVQVPDLDAGIGGEGSAPSTYGAAAQQFGFDGQAAAAEAASTIPSAFDIDGNQVSFEDLSRTYRDAESMRADYTRKTQELGDDRRFLEYVRENPQLQQDLSSFMEDWHSQMQGDPGAQQAAQAAPGADPQLYGQINEMQDVMTFMIEERELNGLKAKYGEAFDPESVKALAYEKGVDFESAYKIAQFDNIPTMLEQQKQSVYQSVQSGRQLGVGGGMAAGGGAIQQPAMGPSRSYQEAAQKLRQASFGG